MSDPPSAERVLIVVARLADELCSSAGCQFTPCCAVPGVMAGSAFVFVVYLSSERSLLVSESSEWNGSAGAGTPVEGRVYERVSGPACLRDSGDDAELEGYEYDNGVSGAGGEANWTCLVWVVVRADAAADGQFYCLEA